MRAPARSYLPPSLPRMKNERDLQSFWLPRPIRMSNPYDPLNAWLRPKQPPQRPISLLSLFPPPKAPTPSIFDLIVRKPPSRPVGALSSLLLKPVKPKVFVSYHHKNDQFWYNQFSKLFDNCYELFTDTSIGRKIDSDNPLYQSRKIREDHISGSSITVVLIGTETWKRKHVDWEIHATLDRKHALLGIALPTHAKNARGEVIVPSRLQDNIVSGFARWTHWSNNAAIVSTAITLARRVAQTPARIANSRPQLSRSLS